MSEAIFQLWFYRSTSRSAVPRQISVSFFSAHPVFCRAEYAAAVGHHSEDKVVMSMLSQHLKMGNLRRIERGVLHLYPSMPTRRRGRPAAFWQPPACVLMARSPFTPPWSCTAVPTPRHLTCRLSRVVIPACSRLPVSPESSLSHRAALFLRMEP